MATTTMSAAMRRCYDLFSKVSRAYGLSIRHLEPEIRDAQCLEALVLRSADTIEDDRAIPNDVKVTMLSSFHKYLRDPTWKYTTGTEEYACVLENFPTITQALGELPGKYREVIIESGSRMSQGMAKYVGKPFNTMKDWNQYCQEVSTPWCVGVYDLFQAAGMEPEITDHSPLDEMTFFWQKTNFIRDFWKDWKSGSLLYPTEVWRKHVTKPGDLLKSENYPAGVQCVNDLVTETLRHAAPGMMFISSLRSPGARKMFGINQILAIATLERCYNSPRPFTEVVKVGRDVIEEVIQAASSLGGILNNMRLYTERILTTAHQTKHPTPGTVDTCRHILSQIDQLQSRQH